MYPGSMLTHSVLGKKTFLLKTQQLILGTGIAIWWVTEPDWITFIWPGWGANPGSLLPLTHPMSYSSF